MELGADSSKRIQRLFAVVGVESPVPVDDHLLLPLGELGPWKLQRYVVRLVHRLLAPYLLETVHGLAPELVLAEEAFCHPFKKFIISVARDLF